MIITWGILRQPREACNQPINNYKLVVTEYISKEVGLGRIAGPYPKDTLPFLHVSSFGVIPKAHQPNQWRLILDLSYPHNHSVNAGISKELCSMSYVSIDEAIRELVNRGSGALMTKIDVKSAFRIIPVHPTDRHLLGMRWQGSLYIDKCLPFGLRSAPKLFNLIADLLHWILVQRGISFLMHYLDDFLTVGSVARAECQQNL